MAVALRTYLWRILALATGWYVTAIAGQEVPPLPPGYIPLPFCEFHTQDNEGVISLLHYHTMTNCTWTVEASSHHTIHLDLRYALRLTTMDSITVYDGADIFSDVLYKFYQTSLHSSTFQHEVFVTTGSYVTLQLAAMGPLYSGDGEGFIGVYTAVPMCPLAEAELTSAGEIMPPLRVTSNFIGYSKNSDCAWRIVAPEGMRVKLTIESFALENSPLCRNDYVAFTSHRPTAGIPWDYYNYSPQPLGRNGQLQELHRYCGHSGDLFNTSIVSTTNTLGVLFHSDYLVELSGFLFTFDFVTGCQGGDFECHSDGLCLSPSKHCDGKADCADASDEEACVCNQTAEFTCTANSSECIPRSAICQTSNTSLCEDGSDQVACQDDDVCIGRNLPLFYLNTTVVAVMTPSWIKTCLSSIPLGKGEKIFTLEILRNSDLVRDSSKAANPNNWLSRHVSFDQYNISVDLAAELKAMELRPYSDMFAFHTDILKLFNKLKDAHTTYQAPFSPLRAYLPLWFATKLVSNSSRQVAIVNQVDGRLARMHSDIYGPTEGGLFKLEGKEIAEINGKPAMMYLREWAEEWPDFKSLSVRLNALMAARSLDLSRHPLPQSSTLALTMASGEVVTVHYLVTFPLPGPESIGEQVVPNLRKNFDHRADYVGYYPVYRDILTQATSASGGGTRARRSPADSKAAPTHTRGKRTLDDVLGLLANAVPSRASLDDESAKYRGTARANHDSTHGSIFTSASGDTRVFRITNTIVFKMKNFADPGAVQQLYDVAQYATHRRITQIVFDLTGNAGGYVKQQYELTRFLVQSWNTVTTLCDSFDFKSATFWSLLSSALNTTESSVPDSLSYNEGMFLARRIANLSSYVAYIYQTPLVNVQQLLGNQSLAETASDQERSRFMKYIISSLLSPYSQFHVSHPDILLSDVTNANRLGEPFSPKRAYYDRPVDHIRGGMRDAYTQRFYMTECKDVLRPSYPPSPFKDIFIITDGRCGSACSQFVTKLQLSGQAKVATFGGLNGLPIDSSSVAGGKAESWQDFWAQYSIDYQLASLTSTKRTIGEAYFVNFSFPLPLTSRAVLTFNFLEYYASGLGKYALPREWYLIPPDTHVLDWPGDLHLYPASHRSDPDISWLGEAFQQQTADALDALYRRVLAVFSGGFPASNILTPPPPFPSCTFIGPCQNSSKLISVRTAAAFVGVDRVAATLRVYSEHSCDDMRLVLHVVAVCEGKDNGADAAGGGTKGARKLIVNPQEYYVTPWSDQWTKVLLTVCSCVKWVTLETQRLTEQTCPASRCKISFIRYTTLNGFWLVHGLRNLYVSNVAATALTNIPKLQPELRYTINSDPRNCPAVVFLKPYFPYAFVDFTELPVPVTEQAGQSLMSGLVEHYKKAASLNCLFLFREPVGRFDDDSSIAFYRTDLECVWAVVVQTGYNLKLSISHELEGNSSLARLDIFSGIDSPSLVSTLYQDELVFTELTISAPSATFKFVTSPNAMGASGFSVQYTAVKQCGGALTGMEGDLASPTVNDTDLYSNNVACSWTITVPSGYRVQLQFHEFDLDLSEGDCEHDSVVLDDPGLASNTQRLCGPFLPPPWSSVGNTAQVSFSSDYVEQHRGFKATWSAIASPGGRYRPSTQRCEVLRDQGGEVSMRWSDFFDQRIYDCNHTIVAPPGSRVRIYFTSFLLNCRGAVQPPGCGSIRLINVTIMSGNDTRSIVVNSGDILPPPYVSTTSTVVVRFRALRNNFQLQQYRGTHYSFQYTVCEACGSGQLDYGPCSGVFPTLCGAVPLTPQNPSTATTQAPNVNPTGSSGTHLSHGEIAIIISCFVGVIFVVSLVLVLRNTGQRGRSHSDGSLTASMASSVSRLIHRGSSNKQPLLKDTDME